MAQYNRKDHYYRKAKAAGLASRAVFKLDELQQQFHLVRRGDAVVDLGCAPGGWLQRLATLVGPSGRVVGVDLEPIALQLPAHVITQQLDLEVLAADATLVLSALGRPADVVVSDAAPHTIGVPFSDAYRSYELTTLAWDCAKALLRPGGHFVCKIFEGPEVQQLRRALQTAFTRVTSLTPTASRAGSKEHYLVALQYKGG